MSHLNLQKRDWVLEGLLVFLPQWQDNAGFEFAFIRLSMGLPLESNNEEAWISLLWVCGQKPFHVCTGALVVRIDCNAELNKWTFTLI